MLPRFFLQVALEEKSSYLTTIATPFGRYRYLRLPFGISFAPEVSHRIVTEAFSDIQGVHTYVDDILVSSTTRQEHDKRLHAVLQRCQELNLKLNRDKCMFEQKSLPYLSHILTSKGIQSTLQILKQHYISHSLSQRQMYLGMITYLAKFSPDLAKEAQPLRQLTQKHVSWT